MDASGEPATVGQDGATDILVPDSGIEIELSPLARHVELHFINLKDAPFVVGAVDATGAVADGAVLQGPTQTHLVARLSGLDPIKRIAVVGGGDNVLLFRICRLDAADPTRDPTGAASPSGAGRWTPRSIGSARTGSRAWPLSWIGASASSTSWTRAAPNRCPAGTGRASRSSPRPGWC